MAIWAERSIESLGYERDLYVHTLGGIPVSVETDINYRIEIPISRSDTWAKIASGRTEALDASDKPIPYALRRHLEVRTPHYKATINELAQMANRDSRLAKRLERIRNPEFEWRRADKVGAILAASLQSYGYGLNVVATRPTNFTKIGCLRACCPRYRS
jgi:hypothetical protein